MNRQSKRFTPNKLMDRLVPVILAILVLALMFALALIILSIVGVLPG